MHRYRDSKETSMSSIQPRQTSRFVRAVRKFFVSGFVVFSFIAYALHEHFTAANGTSDAALPPPIALVTQALPTAAPFTRATEPSIPAAAQPTAAPPPRATDQPIPTATMQPKPTAAPAPPTAEPPTVTPALIAQAEYKDGEYSGPVTDAYYGQVQVKAVIQAGRIADVQFLQYPD